VLEVDGLGLFGKNLHSAASVVVALLEGCERLGGVATEAKFGTKVGPVDLQGSGRTLIKMSVMAENVASGCPKIWLAIAELRFELGAAQPGLTMKKARGNIASGLF
jgi:hypothetical protein